MTLGRGEVVSLLGPSKWENHAAAGGGRAGNRRADGSPSATARCTTARRAARSRPKRNLGGVPVLCPVAAQTVFDNVAYPLKLRKVAAGR